MRTETEIDEQAVGRQVLPGGDDPMIVAAQATAARAAAEEGRAGPPSGGRGEPDAAAEAAAAPGPDDGDDAAEADGPDFLARVQELLRYITELLDVVDGADERFEDDFEERRREIDAEADRVRASADALEEALLDAADRARRIAAQKARAEHFEVMLQQPGTLPEGLTPRSLLTELDQELKLAKGILGAQRMPDLAGLLAQGSLLVNRLRRSADAMRERRVADAAKAKEDAEAGQQHRLDRGLALVHHDLRVFQSELPPATAAWEDDRWMDWQPPERPQRWLRYGSLVRPEFGDVAFPAVLPFPADQGLSIDGGAHRDEAVAAVQAIVLRLLATIPPGQARFTFLDATTMGAAVTPFLALARYRPELVDGGVHTVPEAIDAALVDLTRHVEQVVQQHLRGRYATLEEANRETDDPVPYRFVVVFDHPNGFSDQALKLLKVVCETGPRCGVHPIVVTAPGKGAWGAQLTDLTAVRADRDGFFLDVERAGRWRLRLDAPPSLELHAGDGPEGVFTRILTAVGEGARRARAPQVAPGAICAGWSEEALLHLRPDRPDLARGLALDDPTTWWSAPADRGVGGPLGADGAGQPVGVWLDGDEAPGLAVVGDDREAVSDAVAAAVHGLALAHGPDELSLWLVGLRGRRTLRAYADAELPHARLVAVDVEDRVALAALEAAENELDRRGLLSAALGPDAAGPAGHRAATGEALERAVVVIDGIERLVGGRGDTARRAVELVERLTAEGPALGIHLIVGVGAGHLDARRSRWLSTMVPVTVEVADVATVLAGIEPDPELVRPMRVAGAARLRRLRTMRRRADAAGHERRPQVVLGDEPARLGRTMVRALSAGGDQRRERRMPRLLLGEAASLVGPCEITLQRAPGQHVLVTGGDEVARAGVAVAALLSSLACHGDGVEVRLVDGGSPDLGLAEAIGGLTGVAPVAGARGAAVADLVRATRRDAERRLATRAYGEEPLLVVVHDADRLDDAVRADLAVVARIGAEVGVHLVLAVATLDGDPLEGALEAFGHRAVLGAPRTVLAPLAAELGLGPAVDGCTPPWGVVVDEARGRVASFRPFGLPSVEAISELAELTQRAAGGMARPVDDTVSLAG